MQRHAIEEQAAHATDPARIVAVAVCLDDMSIHVRFLSTIPLREGNMGTGVSRSEYAQQFPDETKYSDSDCCHHKYELPGKAENRRSVRHLFRKLAAKNLFRSVRSCRLSMLTGRACRGVFLDFLNRIEQLLVRGVNLVWLNLSHGFLSLFKGNGN